MEKVALFLLAISLIPLYTEAGDCTGLPTDTELSARLQAIVDSEGGEGGALLDQVGVPFYTCQVQGSTMGTYQMLSVIVTYTIVGTDTAVRVRQFEMNCLEFNSMFLWDAVSNSLAAVDTNVVDYVNIAVRTDCSSCTNTASNDHNCQACNSACNDGLMRCTGTGSNDCCAAFEDSNCIPTPTCSETNFVANEQNNFTCACGLNCTDGYTLNSTLCSCTLTDTCVADHPCTNGVCELVSSPNNYTCDCTGTGYMGTNCSDLIPVPIPSSSPVTLASSTVLLNATPTSTMMSCDDNCRSCNNGCCGDCLTGYNVSGCGCVSIPPPLTCDIRGCAHCGTSSCCSMCEDGFTNHRSDPCACGNVEVSTSNPSPAPSSTNEGTSGRAKAAEQDIPVYIVSVVVGILMLIVLVALIVYVVYYFMTGSAAAASKAKLSAVFMQGEAHDNPMYLDPELIAS